MENVWGFVAAWFVGIGGLMLLVLVRMAMGRLRQEEEKDDLLDVWVKDEGMGGWKIQMSHGRIHVAPNFGGVGVYNLLYWPVEGDPKKAVLQASSDKHILEIAEWWVKEHAMKKDEVAQDDE